MKNLLRRLNPASPIKAVPNSQAVAGTGTVLIGTYSVLRVSIKPVRGGSGPDGGGMSGDATKKRAINESSSSAGITKSGTASAEPPKVNCIKSTGSLLLSTNTLLDLNVMSLSVNNEPTLIRVILISTPSPTRVTSSKAAAIIPPASKYVLLIEDSDVSSALVSYDRKPRKGSPGRTGKSSIV